METAWHDLKSGFARELALPEQEIDLVRAALHLSSGDVPENDVDFCVAQISAIGDRVRARLTGPGRHSLYDVVHAINAVLFDEDGFHGNMANYYDPRNSYLSDVLKSKAGIPISLCVLYQAVALRSGHRLRPIGMPAHFLLAGGQGGAEIYIDAFNRGGLLSRREAIVMAAGGKEEPTNERLAKLSRKFLPVYEKRMVLRRMLNNLKQIYLREKDHARALRMTEYVEIVEPHDLNNLNDRAWLQTELGKFSEAAASLTSLIQRAPSGADMTLAESALRQLRSLTGGTESPEIRGPASN